MGMQKLSEKQSHKPVLQEESLLNDAPLRARVLHVSRQHGVPNVRLPSVSCALFLCSNEIDHRSHCQHTKLHSNCDVRSVVYTATSTPSPNSVTQLRTL